MVKAARWGAVAVAVAGFGLLLGSPTSPGAAAVGYAMMVAACALRAVVA